MATVIKPPSQFQDGFSVFLAGSIELGSAGNWQGFIEKKLSDIDMIIFNPRRDRWDASRIQSKEDSVFRGQVEWELSAMEKANVIVMYFDPNTKSPVSLLELGLFARTGKMVVCCPEGFWRKGNVDIVCARYGVRQVASLNDLVEYVFSISRKCGMASC